MSNTTGWPTGYASVNRFSISGAGYHEGDRVELSIEFIDQSKLPLGEAPLDHGAFRWDGEFPKTAPTGYAIVSMRVFEGAEEVGGLSVSTTVARSTAAGATAPITHAGIGGIQRGRSGLVV